MNPLRLWLDRTASNSADSAPPSVGDGVRAYAIGDIHGRIDLLDQLLAMIANDDAARVPRSLRLIFLGDLVDRGPSSRQVVNRVMALISSVDNVCCLKGNHEEMFVLAARGDIQVMSLFRRVGGEQTLASYGLPSTIASAMSDKAMAEWMQGHVPGEHLDFLDALPDKVEVGDYLFVHAGIRPRVPIADQVGSDMRWIRQEFLDHGRAHPRMIVHGHSITDDVDHRDNRIGIDTGAFYSDRLTAIGLEGTERWFIQTGT